MSFTEFIEYPKKSTNSESSEIRYQNGIFDTPPSDILGHGYNTITGANESKGVLGKPDIIPRNREIYNIEIIENYESLREYMKFSVEASFPDFLGGFDAKRDYFRSIAITEYRLCIMLRVVFIQNIYSLPNPRLDSRERGPEWLLLNGKTQKFLETYGNTYVKDMSTGGELYASMFIHTRSTTERKEIKDSLEYGGVTGDFSGKAELSKRVEKIKKFKSTNVSIYKAGGNSKIPINDLVDYAYNFPTEVRNGPETILYPVHRAYSSADYNPDIEEMPDLEEQRIALETLYDLINSLEERISDFQFAINSYKQFAKEEDAGEFIKNSNETLIKLDSEIKKAYKLSKSIQRESNVGESPPEIPELDVDTKYPKPIRLPNYPLDINVKLWCLGSYYEGKGGETLDSFGRANNIQITVNDHLPRLKIFYQVCRFMAPGSGGGFHAPPGHVVANPVPAHTGVNVHARLSIVGLRMYIMGELEGFYDITYTINTTRNNEEYTGRNGEIIGEWVNDRARSGRPAIRKINIKVTHKF